MHPHTHTLDQGREHLLFPNPQATSHCPAPRGPGDVSEVSRVDVLCAQGVTAQRHLACTSLLCDRAGTNLLFTD